MSTPFGAFVPLTKQNVKRASYMLAEAFVADPVWNAVFEGETKMNIRFPAFFEMPLRHCLKFGEVYASSATLEGVIAFVPGEKADMTFGRIIRSGSLGAAMRMGQRAGKRMTPIGEVLPKERLSFMGASGYLYLFVLGVSPAHQRKGIGARLIEAIISKSNATGLPIYLETETRENVAYYERFGFQMLKRIELPEYGLPIWAMSRQCQS